MIQAKGYVNIPYLQVAAELLKPVKERSYALLHLKPGQTVLDVGCGPASDTINLGQLVGSGGCVIGVDRDPAMIVAVNQRAEQSGLDAVVKHQVVDAATLPFATGQFHACRSERLFIHLPDPGLALAEMIRVTQAGGWIAVADTDWGTLSVDTAEINTERQLGRFRAEHTLHNGYAGRQLYRLFKGCGLTAVTIEIMPVYVTDYTLMRYLVKQDEVESSALAAGAITAEELARWHTDLEQAANRGVFFASLNLILAAGQKP